MQINYQESSQFQLIFKLGQEKDKEIGGCQWESNQYTFKYVI